jgi:autotransporter-associated beta strand protein
VPNVVGASVSFDSNATGNRAVTNDSGPAGFTVGSISFDISSSFTNSLTQGNPATSKLTLDNGGAGVTITTSGFGSGNNTISVPLVLNDLVTAQVDQTSSSSAAGSLNLTATITGPGGFVKQGDGLATFGNGAKTYTGPTVLNGGRLRMSLAARPTTTSSFTINAGSQLTLIPATAGGPQTFTFGSGPLNLNGAGATSGPFAGGPGAIRNDRATGTNGVFSPTITNAVVLQTDTVIHVQALTATGNNLTPDGFLTLSGNVSGPGSLSLTAPNNPTPRLLRMVIKGRYFLRAITLTKAALL